MHCGFLLKENLYMPNAQIPISVFILLKKQDKILLLYRKNTSFNSDKWSLPAGRVESGESATNAMVREAKEEIDIDINLEDLSSPLVMHNHDDQGERMHLFFVCEKWNGEPKNNEPHKCGEIKWHKVSELPDNIISQVETGIRAKLNNKSYIEYGF